MNVSFFAVIAQEDFSYMLSTHNGALSNKNAQIVDSLIKLSKDTGGQKVQFFTLASEDLEQVLTHKTAATNRWSGHVVLGESVNFSNDDIGVWPGDIAIKQGVEIGGVVRGSYAEQVGLTKGDIITHIANKSIRDYTQLVVLWHTMNISKGNVPIRWKRNGRAFEGDGLYIKRHRTKPTNVVDLSVLDSITDLKNLTEVRIVKSAKGKKTIELNFNLPDTSTIKIFVSNPKDLIIVKDEIPNCHGQYSGTFHFPDTICTPCKIRISKDGETTIRTIYTTSTPHQE